MPIDEVDEENCDWMAPKSSWSSRSLSISWADVKARLKAKGRQHLTNVPLKAKTFFIRFPIRGREFFKGTSLRAFSTDFAPIVTDLQSIFV